MKMLINLLLLIGMALGTQTIFAENKSDQSSSFWETLKAKIEQMAPQKKVSATTAVGGVRGARLATEDVYWKGEKIQQTVDADELEVFQKAMALVAAGEQVKAHEAFSEFVMKNPSSPLRKDADEALAQLQVSK